MLTDGLNHVAILTNDAKRLHSFYEEVFEAEVVRDAPETDGDGAVRLSVVMIGPHTELNVFQVEGNTGAASTTSPSRRPRWTPSRRSGTD